MPTWPLVRWCSYGRWSDDGTVVYASHEWVRKMDIAPVIYWAAP